MPATPHGRKRLAAEGREPGDVLHLGHHERGGEQTDAGEGQEPADPGASGWESGGSWDRSTEPPPPHGGVPESGGPRHWR